MEVLKGNFTQVDYDKLHAELLHLEMKKYLNIDSEEDNKRIQDIVLSLPIRD